MKPLPPIVILLVSFAIPITLNSIYPMTRQDMIGVAAVTFLGYLAITALTR